MRGAERPLVAAPTEGSAVVPNPRVPDFFIVGHAKCGTTAIYEMLRRHPQVFMSDPKEPWFFAREKPRPKTSVETSLEFTGSKHESLEDYLALFAAARAEQRVGEASSSYLWSPVAAQRIAAMRPDARIIAMFREPADFLRSLHLQMLSTHNETQKSFRKAVELDGERREGRRLPRSADWPRALIYSDRVKYVEQLRRYHAVFPKEQVLVLIYEDFRDDNEGTLRRLMRFLEIDDSRPIELLEANPTLGVRSVRLDGFRRSLRAGRHPGARALRDVGKALTTKRLREAFYYPFMRGTVYSEPPPVDMSFMLELRCRFKSEVIELSEYLGRDLAQLWGYDSIE